MGIKNILSYTYVPYGVKSHPLARILGQLRDEGQVANLYRRPAKLEYTDWDSKIEYHQSQVSGIATR